MSDDYEVGYKKPPSRTQFKKGNQAAKGRSSSKSLSRKSEPVLDMSVILTKALRAKRTVRRGDVVKELSVAEILVERLILQMTSGTARELAAIVALLEKYVSEVLISPPEPLEIIYHHAEGSTVALPTPDYWERRRA